MDVDLSSIMISSTEKKEEIIYFNLRLVIDEKINNSLFSMYYVCSSII